MQRHVNVGTGVDVTIRELAEQVAAVVGYEGQLTFDASKPDGTPRKLLDVSLLAQLGSRARITLREGLEQTYAWFLDHSQALRSA
jgi:GDP-L-fucose synthase